MMAPALPVIAGKPAPTNLCRPNVYFLQNKERNDNFRYIQSDLFHESVVRF